MAILIEKRNTLNNRNILPPPTGFNNHNCNLRYRTSHHALLPLATAICGRAVSCLCLAVLPLLFTGCDSESPVSDVQPQDTRSAQPSYDSTTTVAVDTSWAAVSEHTY